MRSAAHLTPRKVPAAARSRKPCYHLPLLATRLVDHDDKPVEDRIVVLRGATWADYQRLLAIRGEVSSPRIAYLQADLEIMTPSRRAVRGVPKSEVLPGLDLTELASLLDPPTASQAIREYRAALLTRRR